MTTTAKQPAFRKHVGYQGILLGGFAMLATTLLVMGNVATHDTIELRKADDLRDSLSQVIPAALHDNNLLDDRLTLHDNDRDVVVYRGMKMLKTTAVAFGVSGHGYGGEISLIMGVNRDGEVLGVRVLSHSETPGLGDHIEVAKDDWIYSFDGLSFDKVPEDKWLVKKDGGIFDQFSGATITPRAVVGAVREGLLMFNRHREQLIADKPAIATPSGAAGNIAAKQVSAMSPQQEH